MAWLDQLSLQFHFISEYTSFDLSLQFTLVFCCCCTVCLHSYFILAGWRQRKMEMVRKGMGRGTGGQRNANTL